MRFEKRLGNTFSRVGYHLRSIHRLAIVPFIALNVVLVAVNLMSYVRYGSGYRLEEDIRKYAMVFMPMFSNWWSIFTLREYIEADGNEILFIQSNKIKYSDILILFLLYLLNVSVFLLTYTLLYPQLKLMSIWMIITCWFIFSLTYFLVFFSKSITVTLMCSILYNIINIGFLWKEPTFLLYGSAEGYAFMPEFTHVYFPMLIVGILATIAGIILNYRFTKYN